MDFFKKLLGNENKRAPEAITTITRTEAIEGLSIPGIIRNGQHFFTDLQIYSDGLINCWGLVDLGLFRQKLDNRWVVPSIPDGETLSVYDLGLWTIEDGQWLRTKEQLYDYVFSLVQQLNPDLERLVNYNGSDVKVVNRVRVAKHQVPSPKPYYCAHPNPVFSHKTHGRRYPVFFRNDDGSTYLADLSLYADGRVELTNLPEKKVFVFDQVKELILRGTLLSSPEPGTIITLSGLGEFRIRSGEGIDMQLKYRELADELNELKGGENSIHKCARILEEYRETPTKALKEALRIAYEDIPEHRRIYVGTMDTKDYEVRLAVYGDSVKQQWLDDYGYDYPFGDMPEPADA